MLDRNDRGVSRRSGTDLVRVQQTRALLKNGRDQNGRKRTPAIYLTELGPKRVSTQLKWLVSTVIVAISGLVIIGAVISSSMHGHDGAGMFGTMRQATLEAIKPRATNAPAQEKPVSIGLKTDRLVVSTKGLTTRNLIYEMVTQRRGTRDFKTTKPYVRIVATLATERPSGNVVIPAFNPNSIFGDSTPIAKKSQNGGELTSDFRVSVRSIEIPGGFLPREDRQELTDAEVEHAVAEADALYTESQAGFLAQEGEALKDKAAEPDKHTTVLYKKFEEEEPEDGYDLRTIVGHGGETLDSVIKSTSVDPIQAAQVSEAVSKITGTKKLRSGEEVRLGLSPSSVNESAIDVGKLSLFYKGAHVVTVVRNSDGTYSTNDKPLKPESKYEESSGERTSVYVSIYRAGRSQDLPDDFIMKFIRVHSYDVDFKQKVKSGDGFELFYELVQDENGVEKPGELLYAGVTIGGDTHGYFRFRTPDGGVDYYDDRGSNGKKFLMRQPVRGSVLTSGFGYRKHPLLGTLRPHLGVDWSAPIGTPIMAAGDGIVEMADREGNYGNYIRIRHANGYKTVYAHLLRFASGVTKGVKVRQGQIIGYIGMTGMSTGPHCHFEVLINNQHVDPLSIKIPKSRQLTGRLLTEFRHERAHIDDLMHRPPVKTRVATIEK